MTTPTTVNVRLQLRADTAANWTAANPILLANEVGIETDTKKLKVGNGSTAWNSLAYFPSIVSGGTVLGNLEIGSTGTLTFEGSTADGFETTLAVTNPTADRTITLPNQSGTVVVSGNASIIDADIAANAEIAVSKLADGAARQLLQTDAAGTGVEWTSNVDVPGTLDVTGAATFDGAVTVAGDLTVNGTTTNINTQNLVVEDKNIILGDVATPSDTTANLGGITLKGATDKTINWVDATDAWTSSERFSVPLGSAASPSLTFTGDENSGVYSPGSDQVAIATGGTSRLFVDASGNVGFNKTPSNSANYTTLDINGTNGGQLLLGRTGFLDAFIYSSNGLAALGAGSGSALAFFTNSSGSANERLRITSAGLVGVGTSSPQAELNVAKTGGASTVYIESDAGNNATTSILRFGGASGRSASIQGFRGASSNIHSLDFYTYNSADAFGMRLTPTGLGIGTTTPGSYAAWADDLVVRNSSGDAGLTLASTATETCTIAFANGTTGSQTTNGYIIYNHNENRLSFGTSNTERARIDSSGRLLVGTSSDSGGALFQVNGDRIRVGTAKTPASATATGTAGEICWDANYVYVCTATNTWKRSALSTW